MFQRQVDGHDECAGRDAGDDDQQRRGGQRHREVGQQGDPHYIIFLYHALLFVIYCIPGGRDPEDLWCRSPHQHRGRGHARGGAGGHHVRQSGQFMAQFI